MSATPDPNADWNAAIDEACVMCMSVAEDASEAAEAKDAYNYADGWEDACVECERIIRDLKVKPEDKEQQP
jgi:hypothetical protein